MQLQHIKMTRAVDVNDKIIDIATAENGKSCKCFCIVCKTPLIARQGQERSWSFAHDFSNGEIDCKWSGETELHLRVKEYLAKQRMINVPIGINEPSVGIIEIDSVEVELRIDPINRTPDITVMSNGEQIAIEVAVTSFCDRQKISEYKMNNISAIEFDFSKFKPKSDVIQDEEIEEYFGHSIEIGRWVSVAPASEIGQKVHDHERTLIHKLNNNYRQNREAYSLELRTLQLQINYNTEQLAQIRQSINSEKPEDYYTADLQSEYNLEKHKLSQELKRMKVDAVKEARIDADNEFNNSLQILINNFEYEYRENNQSLIEEISQNENLLENIKQSLIHHQELLENKEAYLKQISKETSTIDESLKALDSKIRTIAQTRIHLLRILPEFNNFYRSTGTPNPFERDIDTKLDVDVISQLYSSIEERQR